MYKIEDWEMDLLKQMRDEKNWHLGESSPKLLFLYLRYVAYPAKDAKVIREIVEFNKQNYLGKTRPLAR